MNYHRRDGTDIVNMEETEKEKDLGVWIDKDLKWSQQCRKSESKAMSVLGMIKMSFKQIDIDSFKILYQYTYSITSRTLCTSLEPILQKRH